jgi:hypothetical protein
LSGSAVSKGVVGAMKVRAVLSPRPADVYDDPYIPFKVRWYPVGEAGALAYYYIEDPAGSKYGYLEIGIEPLTGEILAVVLVLAPQRRKGPGPNLDLPVVAGAVKVEMDAWELNPDAVPTVDRVDVTEALAVSDNERYVYFSFSEDLPVKWVMAGAAGFGVSADDEVTGVVAEKEGPWVGRLAKFVDRQRT